MDEVISSRDRARDLIALAEEAMALQKLGQRVSSEQMRRIEVTGLSSRIDREIRRVGVGTGPWGAVTPEEVTVYSSAQRGLLLILACHPNGFVREAAVEVACDRNMERSGAASPAVARMLVQRALDPVAEVRTEPRWVIRSLFEAELQRQPLGSLLTAVDVAVREILARSAAVDRCPGLVELALDLIAASWHPIHLPMGSEERHRRRQLLRHLQFERPPTLHKPGIQARQRLIDWHLLAVGEIGAQEV